MMLSKKIAFKQMTNTRKELSRLFQLGVIPTGQIDQALIAAKITPDNFAWKDFLSNLLLWLGALALASSVMFFIAYNWDDLGRFAKFGLVQIFIALSIFLYWKTSREDTSETNTKTKKNRLISQLSLLMASILLGGLLAFYGQTYQTGADTWELFLTWCVLILPWTVISRFPAQWIIWLALLNLSIILYFQTFSGIFGIYFTSDTSMLWILTIINSIALAIWELLKNHWQWLSESWATRILALASGAPLTFLVIESIFNRQHNLLPGILWIAGLSLIYMVYRKLKPDLFMLAMACLSGISVIVSLVGRKLFDSFSGDVGAFLILAVLVIALGGASAVWLKQILQEQQATTRKER